MAIRTDSFSFKYAKLMLGKSTRIRLYRQIRIMTRNQVRVTDCLEAIFNNASRGGKKKDHPEAIIARFWIERMENGMTFAEAIRGTVPDDEQMLLEAGELGGGFDKSLGDVIDLILKRGKIKGAVIGGIAYPTFLLITLFIILWLFGVKVIPPFALALPVEKWTGLAASMAWLATAVRVGTIPLVAVIAVLASIYFYTLPRWSGRSRVRFDRIPPWSMYRMFIGAGFMLSLSALIRADVPVKSALERLRKNANPYLNVRISSALHHNINGEDIGDALQKAGYEFPDRQIVSDLGIYAKMDGFAEMLDTTSKEWIDQAADRVAAQAKILNMAMLLLLAGAIIWMWIGVFQITDQISSAAMFNM